MQAAGVDDCAAILFDEKTGTFNDDCFLKDRDRQNEDGARYRLRHLRADPCEGVLSFASCHPNLRARDGFGFLNSCNVDVDSDVRITGSVNTNSRERQTLTTRVAHASPALFRGRPDMEVESDVIHSSVRDTCPYSRAGREFAPLAPCVESALRVEHIVPSWKVANARSIGRQRCPMGSHTRR